MASLQEIQREVDDLLKRSAVVFVRCSLSILTKGPAELHYNNILKHQLDILQEDGHLLEKSPTLGHYYCSGEDVVTLATKYRLRGYEVHAYIESTVCKERNWLL